MPKTASLIDVQVYIPTIDAFTLNLSLLDSPDPLAVNSMTWVSLLGVAVEEIRTRRGRASGALGADIEVGTLTAVLRNVENTTMKKWLRRGTSIRAIHRASGARIYTGTIQRLRRYETLDKATNTFSEFTEVHATDRIQQLSNQMIYGMRSGQGYLVAVDWRDALNKVAEYSSPRPSGIEGSSTVEWDEWVPVSPGTAAAQARVLEAESARWQLANCKLTIDFTTGEIVLTPDAGLRFTATRKITVMPNRVNSTFIQATGSFSWGWGTGQYSYETTNRIDIMGTEAREGNITFSSTSSTRLARITVTGNEYPYDQDFRIISASGLEASRARYLDILCNSNPLAQWFVARDNSLQLVLDSSTITTEWILTDNSPIGSNAISYTDIDRVEDTSDLLTGVTVTSTSITYEVGNSRAQAIDIVMNTGVDSTLEAGIGAQRVDLQTFAISERQASLLGDEIFRSVPDVEVLNSVTIDVTRNESFAAIELFDRVTVHRGGKTFQPRIAAIEHVFTPYHWHATIYPYRIQHR